MIKNMGKEEKIILVSSVFLLAFAAVYICLAQWTEPSASPPSGNVDAPINTGSSHQGKLAGNIYAAAFYSSTGGDYFLDLDTASATSTIAGDLTVEGNGNFGTTTIGGGSGKINVGTIDPIFEIEGKKYSTYVPDYAGGTRIENSGVLKLGSNGEVGKWQQEINFKNLEKESDLWLFWQASNKNIDDVSIILTPSFSGNVWYEKEEAKITVYGNQKGEVSYNLSAPRVDYDHWGNLSEDQTLSGIKVE